MSKKVVKFTKERIYSFLQVVGILAGHEVAKFQPLPTLTHSYSEIVDVHVVLQVVNLFPNFSLVAKFMD